MKQICSNFQCCTEFSQPSLTWEASSLYVKMWDLGLLSSLSEKLPGSKEHSWNWKLCVSDLESDLGFQQCSAQPLSPFFVLLSGNFYSNIFFVLKNEFILHMCMCAYVCTSAQRGWKLRLDFLGGYSCRHLWDVDAGTHTPVLWQSSNALTHGAISQVPHFQNEFSKKAKVWFSDSIMKMCWKL